MFATKLNTKNRLVAMLLDPLIVTFVLTILGMPAFIFRTVVFGHPNVAENPFSLNLFHVFLISLYFNKDCYIGQSIGKRLLRFQVLDIKTGLPANALRCLVRNLTLLIWPVEVIMSIINVERRLGDFIAGTRLANYETVLTDKPNWGMILAALVIGVGFTYVAIYIPREILLRVMAIFPSAYSASIG
jgi:uncharacterized RDD family membrane protein YckC